MTLMCMARVLWQGVKGQLCCAGSAAGAVRAQSLDGDGGSGEGPLLGANITCRQDTFSCHVHSAWTLTRMSPSVIKCQQLMTDILRPSVAGHYFIVTIQGEAADADWGTIVGSFLGVLSG